MTICVEVRIFSQFCLLHEMLHNLGVQLLYFISFFSEIAINYEFQHFLNAEC
jgi:hypothetical protein